MLGVMKSKHFWHLCSLFAIVGLTGCDLKLFTPEPWDPLMSEKAIATRQAPPERVFHGTLAGESVFLILDDCEVFRVERSAAGRIEWTSLVKPEFYPFFTGCVRQSMTYKAGVLEVVLGRQAFGAGGCCASGGTYRSVDGRTWKKL